MFVDGDVAILNYNAKNGLPSRVGERCVIVEENYYNHSPNYKYRVEFDDGKTEPVKESELNKLTEQDIAYMEYIYRGNTVLYAPINEEVVITKVDYLHGQAEVDFVSGGSTVLGFEQLKKIDEKVEDVHYNKIGYFGELGLSIGNLVDKKQKAYGDSVTKCYEIMKVLLQDYRNNDNTYTIPESLIPIMLLEVRKIDKTNRRFSNPNGDLMDENPYQDDVGYSMLGVRLMDQLKEGRKCNS